MATGPRIPGSVNLESNYTRNLECEKIICTSLTDNFATLSGGRLSNLKDPINSQDASTKAYSDSKLDIVSDPLNSIQFNNNGSFDGSSNLTFDENQLYSLNTLVGTASTMLTINSGVISNLAVPTTQQNPLTKGYVDDFFKLSTVTTASTSMLYTAADMVNVVLVKSSGTSSDTTDTATNIVAQINSLTSPVSTGTNFRFVLKNTHTSGTLSIAPGSGVTILPSTGVLTVYPSYELDTTIQVSSSSTVNLLVTNLSWLNSNVSLSNFLIGPRSLYTTSHVTRVSNKFNFNTSTTVLTTENVVYLAPDLVGIVHRSFEGPKVDSFGDIDSFISSYSSLNSPIFYVFSTGAIEIVIKNTSTTGPLVLEGNSEWIMDENSNMTIGVGQTGYFYLYIDVINKIGYIYTIGIMSVV